MRIEFWLWPDGTPMFRDENSGDYRKMSEADTDIVDEVLRILEVKYPKTYAALEELYAKSRFNRLFFRYIMAERFIRCNWSTHDNITDDLDGEQFNFEEVVCPLRGRCKHEGIICMPKPVKIVAELSIEENRICQMYSEGMGIDEIAAKTFKSPSTVNNQLCRAAKVLGCKRHEIAKYFQS